MKRSTLLSVLGVVLVLLGGIGVGVAAMGLLKYSQLPIDDPLIRHAGFEIVVKVLMLASGIMVFKRYRPAAMTFAAAMAVSTIGSFHAYFYVIPDQVAQVQLKSAMNEATGLALVVFGVVFVLYAMVLAFLLLPKTQAEFVGSDNG